MGGMPANATEESLRVDLAACYRLTSLGYHHYEGIALRDDEKPRLVRDLGSQSALILRNHGLLTVGPTVADAFLVMYTLQRACEIQIAAQSAGAKLLCVDARITKG